MPDSTVHMASTTTTTTVGKDPDVDSSLPPAPVCMPVPDPPVSATPEGFPPLSPDQLAKYTELLRRVQAWDTPAAEAHRQWLTRECLLRYLRATRWAVDAADERLRTTVAWRESFGVVALDPDAIALEQCTGKQAISGYDVAARPCLYLLPARQNTSRSDPQIVHLIFMLERVIDLMPAGVESLALILSHHRAGPGGNSSVSQGKTVLHILQHHYPERLGVALINQTPWYVSTFFKLISPFIDPTTKRKLVFNPVMPDHVDVTQLLDILPGGAAPGEYDHDRYWPALLALCDERRAEMRARWEAAGSRVGESELYLRGAPGCKPAEEPAPAVVAAVQAARQDEQDNQKLLRPGSSELHQPKVLVGSPEASTASPLAENN